MLLSVGDTSVSIIADSHREVFAETVDVGYTKAYVGKLLSS